MAGEPPLSDGLALGRDVGIAQTEDPVALGQRDLDGVAVAQHGDAVDGAVERDLQRIVEATAGEHRVRAVQVDAPASTDMGEAQAMHRIAIRQKDELRAATLQAPAIMAFPRIGRRAGGGQQHLKRRGGQRQCGRGARRRLQVGSEAVGEAGVELRRLHRRMRDQALQEAEVAGDAGDPAFTERRRRAAPAPRPGSPGDQLGDHRVVEGRDRVARPHAALDPHPGPVSGRRRW